MNTISGLRCTPSSFVKRYGSEKAKAGIQYFQSESSQEDIKIQSKYVSEWMKAVASDPSRASLIDEDFIQSEYMGRVRKIASYSPFLRFSGRDLQVGVQHTGFNTMSVYSILSYSRNLSKFVLFDDISWWTTEWCLHKRKQMILDAIEISGLPVEQILSSTISERAVYLSKKLGDSQSAQKALDTHAAHACVTIPRGCLHEWGASVSGEIITKHRDPWMHRSFADLIVESCTLDPESDRFTYLVSDCVVYKSLRQEYNRLFGGDSEMPSKTTDLLYCLLKSSLIPSARQSLIDNLVRIGPPSGPPTAYSVAVNKILDWHTM